MSDRFLAFTGTLPDINTAVGLLMYAPDEHYNSRQYLERLTVAIQQAESSEAKVRLL